MSLWECLWKRWTFEWIIWVKTITFINVGEHYPTHNGLHRTKGQGQISLLSKLEYPSSPALVCRSSWFLGLCTLKWINKIFILFIIYIIVPSVLRHLGLNRDLHHWLPWLSTLWVWSGAKQLSFCDINLPDSRLWNFSIFIILLANSLSMYLSIHLCINLFKRLNSYLEK